MIDVSEDNADQTIFLLYTGVGLNTSSCSSAFKLLFKETQNQSSPNFWRVL